MVEKEGILKYLNRTILLGGGLAFIQSITWIVLTSLGIAEYNKNNTDEIGYPEFNELFEFFLKYIYFSGDPEFELLQENVGIRPIMRAKTLFIWNSVYLSFSILWLISSLVILKFVKWEKISSTYMYLYPWVITTLALCLMDIIIGSLLAQDVVSSNSFVEVFQNMINGQTKSNKLPSFLKQGLLQSPMEELDPYEIKVTLEMIIIMGTYMKWVACTLMLLASRGFVLWIVNFVCATFLLSCAVEIRKRL